MSTKPDMGRKGKRGRLTLPSWAECLFAEPRANLGSVHLGDNACATHRLHITYQVQHSLITDSFVTYDA